MKKLLTILIVLANLLAYSQQTVTVTAADMPVSGNNFEYNHASPNLQFNANQTGNNYTWDFTGLLSNSVSTDSFLNVLQTPLVYNLAFNLPFDPERATVANNLAPLPSFGGIPLPVPVTFSDENSFFRTESGVFKQVGFAFAANFNGTNIPLPVKFTDVDEIYSLPLAFGQTPAPTQSRYEFQIPGLMTYIENSTRTNTVDGQGVLMLPNGNFNVLRIKSEIAIQDSAYLDTLGFWLPVPPRTVIEYKWVSANHGWPVLIITGQQTTFPFNQFQLNSVKYLKLAPTGIEENTANFGAVKVYPVPATDKIFVEGLGLEEVWITGIDGKIIFNEKVNTANAAHYTVNLVTNPPAGMYIITIKTAKNYQSFKLPIR